MNQRLANDIYYEVDCLRELESRYVKYIITASFLVGASAGVLAYMFCTHLFSIDNWAIPVVSSLAILLVGVVFADRCLKTSNKVKKKRALVESLIQIAYLPTIQAASPFFRC